MGVDKGARAPRYLTNIIMKYILGRALASLDNEVHTILLYIIFGHSARTLLNELMVVPKSIQTRLIGY